MLVQVGDLEVLCEIAHLPDVGGGCVESNESYFHA